MQEPAASAGQHRQEELEAMTDTLSRELDGSDDPEAAERFRSSTERLLVAEVKLGWLQALNLQGSGGLAKLGPIAVVVIAAFMGTQYVGTLISLYLLAQRVFWSFDGLVDLSLGMNSVRGPVARCFELIDAKAAEPKTPALVGR
jgi:ABC-type bacteriocin/lantibiotic exporter with double-glycine peptidase domain